VADVSGPAEVSQSGEAAFDAYISFKGEAYPQAAIDKVSYMIYDASGKLALSGEASAVAEGQYSVTLTAEQLAKLTAGVAKIEFVVSSNVVAIPTFASLEFVVSQ
jgi:hypothetical protein